MFENISSVLKTLCRLLSTSNRTSLRTHYACLALRCLCIGILSVVLPGNLSAATVYWDADGDTTAATGGTGIWETSSSLWRNGSATGTLTTWPTALASASDATAVLGGTAGTLTLNSSVILGGMQVVPSSGTSYTVSGSGRLNFIPVSGTPVVDVQSGSTLTLTAAINGVNGLQKNSAGTLILDSAAGTARLLGSITVAGGTLQAGSATNNGASQVLRSNAVNLAGGTSLTTVGTTIDLRVGALSGSGSVTPAVGGAINVLAREDATFSGAITTTGGLTLRGGNGTTQTFNGNLTGLTGTIGINSGATMKLSGTATNAGVLGSLLLATRGGTITLDNSGGNAAGTAGRIADTAALTFLGGKFELIGNSAGTSETVGVYTMNVGQNTITVNNGGGTGAALTLASFTRTSGNAGTVNFVGAGTGTFGSSGNNSRVILTTAPGTTNNVIANSAGSGILGFATVNGTDFAGYGANGVVAVNSTAVSGALATAATQNSVLTANGATIAGSNVSYNTLKIAPTSSGFTLDLTGAGALNTAGILLAGNNDFTIRNTGAGTGGLIAGNQRFVNVANAGTTLSVGVSLLSSNNAFTKSGDGILALTGTASQVGGTSATKYGVAGGVFRGSLISLGGGTAAGGANTTIQLRGGVLEISGGGTLTRAIDLASTASGGSITFDEGTTDRGDGGFSAIGGAAIVTLVTTIGGATAASLVWNDNAFLSNGYVLTMGSTKADSRVDLTNAIGLDNGTVTNNYFAREIRVDDNTGSANDVARLSGVISGSANADLLKTGAGVLELTGTNTYAGNTLIQQGTLLANNTGSTSATGTGSVILGSGAVLGGTGRIATAADGQVFVQGTLRVGSVAPTTGEKLTIDSSASGAMTIIASTGIIEFDLFTRGGDLTASTTAADRLGFSGMLSLQSGARLKINNLTGASSSTTFASGDVWRLFDWSSLTVSGTFTTDVADLPTLGSGLVWDFSNLYTAGTITVAVPEPTRGMLLLLGGVLLIFRRRKING